MKRIRFSETELARQEPRFFARPLDRDDGEFVAGFTHEIQILNDEGQAIEAIVFAYSDEYSEAWLPVPYYVYEATRGIKNGVYLSSVGNEMSYN